MILPDICCKTRWHKLMTTIKISSTTSKSKKTISMTRARSSFRAKEDDARRRPMDQQHERRR